MGTTIVYPRVTTLGRHATQRYNGEKRKITCEKVFISARMSWPAVLQQVSILEPTR